MIALDCIASSFQSTTCLAWLVKFCVHSQAHHAAALCLCHSKILLYHTCLKKATTEMVHMFSIAPKANHIGALGSCHMRGRCFFFRLTSGLMEGDSSSFISSVYIFLWPSQCQLLSKLFSPFFMFVWQTFFGWKKLLLYPRAPIIFGKYNKNNENIIKSGEMSLNVINDVDSAQKIIWLKILLQQIF